MTSNAPSYRNTATGSVYASFYCPDAATCSNVLPQLIYSALPAQPWSLSVPIAWDNAASTHWSVEGMDDGGTHRVSLVIYNADQSATSYKVYVYNSAGTLCRHGHDAFDSAPAESRERQLRGRRDIQRPSVADCVAVAVGHLQSPR